MKEGSHRQAQGQGLDLERLPDVIFQSIQFLFPAHPSRVHELLKLLGGHLVTMPIESDNGR